MLTLAVRNVYSLKYQMKRDPLSFFQLACTNHLDIIYGPSSIFQHTLKSGSIPNFLTSATIYIVQVRAVRLRQINALCY